MLGAFQGLIILKKEKKMKKQLLALLILGAFVGQVHGAQKQIIKANLLKTRKLIEDNDARISFWGQIPGFERLSRENQKCLNTKEFTIGLPRYYFAMMATKLILTDLYEDGENFFLGDKNLDYQSVNDRFLSEYKFGFELDIYDFDFYDPALEQDKTRVITAMMELNRNFRESALRGPTAQGNSSDEDMLCAKLFKEGLNLGMNAEDAFNYVELYIRSAPVIVGVDGEVPQVCPHGPNVACGCMVPKQQEEVVFEDCPICMFSLLPEEDLSVTPCGHTYHSECLKMSSKVKKECPLCRGKL